MMFFGNEHSHFKQNHKSLFVLFFQFYEENEKMRVFVLTSICASKFALHAKRRASVIILTAWGFFFSFLSIHAFLTQPATFKFRSSHKACAVPLLHGGDARRREETCNKKVHEVNNVDARECVTTLEINVSQWKLDKPQGSRASTKPTFSFRNTCDTR